MFDMVLTFVKNTQWNFEMRLLNYYIFNCHHPMKLLILVTELCKKQIYVIKQISKLFNVYCIINNLYDSIEEVKLY